MNEFSISNDISSTRNNRIIVFHGNEEIDGRVYNGEMDVLSSLDMFESCDHFVYLRDYLEKRYSNDISIMSIVKNDSSVNQYPLLLFMTEEYGDVVFENVSTDEELDCGEFRQSGVFYIPEVVSEKQRNKIISLKEYFKTFNQLTVARIDVNDKHMVDKEPIDFFKGQDFNKIVEYLDVKKDKIRL